MKISTLRVTCSDCSTVSDVEIVLGHVDVAVASMRSARCPLCRSKKLCLGGAHDDAPPLTASVDERASWWWKRGDVGLSSSAIFVAMVGWTDQQLLDHALELFRSNGTLELTVDVPHDGQDVKRCLALLALIPEWRDFGPVILKRFPWWKPFVDNWPALSAGEGTEATIHYLAVEATRLRIKEESQ